MRIPKDGQLLRIFVGESDQHDGKPLYEEIVHIARKQTRYLFCECRVWGRIIDMVLSREDGVSESYRAAYILDPALTEQVPE